MKKLVILSSFMLALFGACTKTNITEPNPEPHARQVATLTGETTYGRAWAWYNGSSAPAAFQFTSLGTTVSILRISTGNYRVTFPGMGHLFTGIVHAVAYGGNHTAQVQSWGSSGADLVANIKCFAPCGTLADGRFVAFFYKETRGTSYNSAYMWSNSTSYHYNSKGLRNTLTRVSTGVYRVNFPGLVPNSYGPGERGNIIVTPYGPLARRCQVGRWSLDASGVTSTVYTYDGCGNVADADFTISYISDFGIGQQGISEDPDYGAYVWYDLNTTPTLAYQQTNASSTNITVTKIDTGYYEVTIPYVIRNGISSIVIASSYGTDKSYVSVQSWSTNASTGKTKVYIKCYAPNGIPMINPVKFTLFFYTIIIYFFKKNTLGNDPMIIFNPDCIYKKWQTYPFKKLT